MMVVIATVYVTHKGLILHLIKGIISSLARLSYLAGYNLTTTDTNSQTDRKGCHKCLCCRAMCNRGHRLNLLKF